MPIILPFNQHILNNVHIFLAKCLEPITIRLPKVIQHSMEFIHNATKTEWLPEQHLLKADIVALYPNINLDNPIHLAAKALSGQSRQDCNMLTYREWHTIIKYAHYELEFSWMNNIWFCNNGVPIGSLCGPHLAILGHTMEHI